MPAYATIEDAVALYGEDYVTVAFDRNGDGEVDTEAAELMLEVVSSEIDSFLVGRVEPLPVSPVPRDLMMRCVDLAIYRMCPDAARLTEEKTRRFDAAQKWLAMVARGEIKLTYGSAAVTSTHQTQRARIVTAEVARASQTENSRWFSRDKKLL